MAREWCDGRHEDQRIHEEMADLIHGLHEMNEHTPAHLHAQTY
jgi:hypothetical protein